MLLLVPTRGYLEGPGGPWPTRHVEWVEITGMRIKGGMRGLPVEIVDITEELLAGLRGMAIAWDLRDAMFANRFAEKTVRVVHIPNPWGPPEHGPTN
ncbi:MAG TPA: hypothetical protein VGH28_27120 [Polyangiaceae bacterium]